MFKVGDKVRVIANEYDFDNVTVSDLGVVTKLEEGSDLGSVYVKSVTGAWGGEEYYFFARELEKVDVNLGDFTIGDRVILSGSIPYRTVSIGQAGTVTGFATDRRGAILVEVDASEDYEAKVLSFHPHELSHLTDAVTEPEKTFTREEVLENAVMFAHGVFLEYMEMHRAKGEDGAFKARTNFGFATVMETALAYKAD